MNIALLSLGILSAGLFFTGCGRSEGERPASSDKTGVETCDAYVARLETCAGKQPADDRAAQQAAIRAARDLLEEKADKAEADGDRVALADACKRMADALGEEPRCK
jgi:hypothetical protein